MIFITSYPYIGERHLRVFDYFKNRDNVTLILPEVWKLKGGKIVMKPNFKSGLNIIPAKAYFSHSNYPIVRGLMKGWMPATYRILKKKAKPGDVLYTVSEPNLLVTYLNGLVAKRLGLKHIFFTWQNIPYNQRLSGVKLKLTEWLIRKNIFVSCGAICGNTKSRDILLRYAGGDFKIIVAPVSGIDSQRFRPEVKSGFRRKNKLEDKIIVTFAGVLDKRKGIELLLEAFLSTLSEVPNLYLVMIGIGPLKDTAEKFVGKNKIASKVKFINWLPNFELPGIFANSDIFVYSSQPHGGWEEQFGYSIAEASASGLPVVSTKTGSIEEVAVDKVTGILIKPGSSSDLAEAIVVLAQNRSLRKSMGLAGRKFILRNFDHEVVARKMESFLNNL